MSKTINKLVLVLAATMMFAGSAYAGVNGCFQFTKQTSDFATLDAAFTLTDGTGANANGTVTLAAGADCTTIFGASNATATPGQEVAKVAYELTKAYNVDLANVNAGGLDDSVMYVSTTDIPGASRLTFTLTNAKWQDSVMYLLKWDPTGGAGAGAWAPIAATDGAVANQAGATFLFQSGITVQAGTKLMLSKDQGTGTGTTAAFIPPKLKIGNTDCSPSNNVTLNVTSALTDGLQTITGALTGTSGQLNILVQTPLQFGIALPAAPTTSEVDVEPPSLRTNFVKQDGGAATADASTLTFTTAKLTYSNSEAAALTLDNQVTLGAGDFVQTKIYADKAVDSFMKVQLYNSATYDGGGQYTINNAAVDTLGVAVSDGTTDLFDISPSLATATQYDILATDIFNQTNLGGANSNDVYGVLITTDTTQVMPYNYKVNANQKLHFDAASNYIDSCVQDKSLFSVGINGAVFKVPYIFNNASTFIRVSNEDSTDALIYGDFFEGGVECTNVPLGTIPAKASNLMFGDALVTTIAAQGGACATLAANIPALDAGRFFGTFTVTSPKDKVHAFGVQKITNGVDRVLTILDQNAWVQ